MDGRTVGDVANQLQLDLVHLLELINLMSQGISGMKREMHAWREDNPIEVFEDQHEGFDQSDPHMLDSLQVEWEQLRGRVASDLVIPLTDYRRLALGVQRDHQSFDNIAARTSNVTSVFYDRAKEWSESLGRLASRVNTVKNISFAAAAIVAIPYAAGAAAALGIEGGGSLALGRAGLGMLGGGLVDGGLHATDLSDPRSLAARTVAGTEDGMLMGAAGPTGEAGGAVAKWGAGFLVDESAAVGRTISSVVGGAAEAATGAGSYATGATLANGGDLSAAVHAGIETAKEAAPFGALLGVATRDLHGGGGEAPAAAPPIEQGTRDSVDVFCVGEVPKSGPARWKYLEDANNWLPERRALHEQLLAEAKAEAQRFADAQAASGGPPTIYAMRGNTAVGKSRTAKNDIGEIQAAVKSTGDMRSVNPDNFKVRLMTADGRSFTSAQVHSESSMLASRLERELAGIKTSKGDVGSLMIDKRLATVEDVQHYAQLAKQTGRRLALYDVDAPLEVSLAGVLERAPGGSDPLPDFKVVGDGFEAVRLHRKAVVETFINDPTLGSYELYGTSPAGAKILVASVEKGQLSIFEPAMYTDLIRAAHDVSAGIGQRVIDEPLIEQITAALPPQRAVAVRGVLEKYVGKTWREALDGHSRERAMIREER